MTSDKKAISISDLILKLLSDEYISIEAKRKSVEKIVTLQKNIIATTCAVSHQTGEKPKLNDLAKIAKYELKDYLESIDPICLNELIISAAGWMEQNYAYNSCWNASILIMSLLRAKDGIPEIDKHIEWLKNERNLTVEGLWHSPWDPRTNIFDTSFAVVALIEAGVSEDEDIIIRGINFIQNHINPLGGWHSIPGDDEEIEVGATSWAIIALIKAGISPSSEIIITATKWLRENQWDNGGWARWWKNKQGSTPLITRTCDAVGALLVAGESPESPCVQNAIKWLIDLQNLVEIKDNFYEVGWGWRRFESEKIIISDIENTSVAITTLLKGNVDPSSSIIAGGIKFLLEKADGESFWHHDTPRAIICLRKYLNSLTKDCMGHPSFRGPVIDDNGIC